MNCLVDFLKKKIGNDSSLYYCLSLARNRPISFLVICLYSIYYTKKLTGNWSPIKVRFSGRLLPLAISAKSGQVVAEGNLIIESWQNGKTPISISLGSGSQFILKGDFNVGQGVKIAVGDGATLHIGGRRNSSGSGITCDSMIMVAKRIDIGTDVIVSWGVYITDGDWHKINGEEGKEPVYIGDDVWISHDASILKGGRIGNGSIIGAKSLVTGSIPEHCLAAGIPAKVIRENICWTR